MTDVHEQDTEQTEMQVRVLGKIIGTATGWDQPDTAAFSFNDFKPNELGKKFLSNWEDKYEGLMINFETGEVQGIYCTRDKDTRDEPLAEGEENPWKTDNILCYWRYLE